MKRCNSLRSRRKRGGGRGARTRKKGDWGLGTRERLLQRPPFFHFCGRQRPQNSDWLIFDSTSHGNDEFDEDVQLEDLNLVAAGWARVAKLQSNCQQTQHFLETHLKKPINVTYALKDKH